MRSSDTSNKRFDFVSGFYYRKNIRNGIFYLALLILVLQAVYWFVDFSSLFPSPTVDKKGWIAFQKKMDSIERQEKKRHAKESYATKEINVTSKFNPNTLKESEWIELGFSKLQVKTILKYKKSIGGFKTKNDVRKCYVVSEKKFKKLEPWLDIKSSEKQSNKKNSGTIFESHKQRKLFLFDPDTLSTSNWEQLGFSPKQAKAIIRYKRSIGRFVNKEQIRKSYVISDEKFREIEPYIRFQKNNPKYRNEKEIKKTDINKATIEEIKKIKGIGSVRAKTTINYRNSLGGFALLSQINKVYGLRDLPLDEVEKYFYTNPDSIKKINLATASLETLSKHILLSKNQAKRIVHYRKRTETPSLEALFQSEEFNSADASILQYYFHFVKKK